MGSYKNGELSAPTSSPMREALARHKGTRKSGGSLGISRSYLYRKLSEMDPTWVAISSKDWRIEITQSSCVVWETMKCRNQIFHAST